MAKQFFFMFSSGEYSDYRVGGLFVCDHEVTQDEWKSHYRTYQDKLAELGRGDQTWDEWYDAGGYEKQQAWAQENDPEVTFQKLHGMQPMPVSEFWRDA